VPAFYTDEELIQGRATFVIMRTGLIAGCYAAVVGLAPAALAVTPKADAPLAILAWPWQTGAALATAAAAGGTLIAGSASGTVAIVRPGGADFVTRLYAAGATLVLDASAVQACLPSTAFTDLHGPSHAR